MVQQLFDNLIFEAVMGLREIDWHSVDGLIGLKLKLALGFILREPRVIDCLASSQRLIVLD